MPSRADAEAFLAQSTPTVDGWHCVAICGYDDSRSRFEFKNSWGTAWGNSGYGTLPYGYVDKLSASAMIAS
jgi:C1A family cysteine protease